MVFGIDIGTTGCKSVLIDPAGTLRAFAYTAYPTLTRDGQLCQDPVVWKEAVVKTVRACLAEAGSAESVSALAFSFQSGTMIPLGNGGEPLDPAVLWLDNGAEEQAKQLLERYPQTFFYRKTGWRLAASFNLLQIMKYRQEKRQAFDACRRFAHVADYLHEWLCGDPAVDICSAGNSMLLNVPAGVWDDDLLGLCGIGASRLGRLETTGSYLGVVKPEIAALLGIPAATRVYCGAQDQFCSAIAAQATSAGDLVFSMGTSWVLMEVTRTPRFDDERFAGVNNYPIPGRYCSYVYIPTGGKALNWLRQLLTARRQPLPDYDEMTKAAETVAAGADGLFFVDRLAGTLFPSWQADSEAAFIGLRLEHEQPHLIRAVLEGVCFEYAIMLRALAGMGGAEAASMIALGGASRSRLWMQIAASVFQKTLHLYTEPDLAPIGAAVIAARGEGLIGGYEDASDWCRLERRIVEPDDRLVPIYEERLNAYIDRFR